MTGMYIVALLQTVYTGLFEFEMYVPYEVFAYSVTWWVEVVLNQVVLWYCAILYAIYDGIYFDALLQISFLHRVQHDRLRNLSGTDEEIRNTLVSTYCELQELKG